MVDFKVLKDIRETTLPLHNQMRQELADAKNDHQRQGIRNKYAAWFNNAIDNAFTKRGKKRNEN